MWPVRIREHECGLLFSKGKFVRALLPGLHWVWRAWRMSVVKISRLEPHLPGWAADLLLHDDRVKARLEVVELGPSQRALVWMNARLACVVGPGRHVFWAEPALLIEVRDIAELRLEHPRMQEIVRHAAQTTLYSVINVAADEELGLFAKGVLVETLGQGTHVLWQGPSSIRWKIVKSEAVAETPRSQPESALGPQTDKPPASRGNLRV